MRSMERDEDEEEERKDKMKRKGSDFVLERRVLWLRRKEQVFDDAELRVCTTKKAS